MQQLVGRTPSEDSVRVKYGWKEFTIGFIGESISSGNIRVGDLRQEVAKAVDEDVDRIQLSYDGAMLEDDQEALSAAGVKPGSKVLLTLAAKTSSAAYTDGDSDTGKSKKAKRKKKKTAKKKDEKPAAAPEPIKKVLTPNEQIDAIRTTNETIIYPLIDAFLANPPKGEKLEDEHRRLTESLMAELLKLDSVESPDPETRANRKALVKEMQARFDSLDKTFREAKL